ncbi:MAG: lipopolysaccharide biosynthesis protein, partial [Colwellia sp.]
SVSEILSRFTDYQIQMELALQAYTSSQISLEKSRIEAYRQMKYLIVVEQATLSEDNKYPDVVYNISLFVLLLSMAFGIGKIIVSTVNELK